MVLVLLQYGCDNDVAPSVAPTGLGKLEWLWSVVALFPDTSLLFGRKAGTRAYIHLSCRNRA